MAPPRSAGRVRGVDTLDAVALPVEHDVVAPDLDTDDRLGTDDILRQFALILDYPKERVTFIPNAKFGQFDEEYKIGIAMADDDGKILITMVAPKSAAERVGVKKGDQVVAINGVSLDGKTAIDARGLIDPKRQQEYALALVRDGKPVSLKVRSARALE